MKRPTVALCMIAKDEAPVIGRALASARAFVDEIVVVDTGSTDATAEIAKAHGARVISFPWNGSFSDARNVYLRAATADWILVLDADEELDAAASAILESFLHEEERDGRLCAYWLREVSPMPAPCGGLLGDAPLGVEHYILRFFPRRAELSYFGAIHEQLGHPRGAAGLEMRALAAVIHHHGYRASELERKDRNARNLPLLEGAVAADPEDPFARFNLGSHFQMVGRYDEALEELRRSKALSGGNRGQVPYMASRAVILADVLLRLGRGEEAVCELQECMRDFPGIADAPFHLGNVLLSENEVESAEEAFRRAIEIGAHPIPTYFGLSDSGAATWKPRLQLGMSLGRRGRWQDARHWLQEACAQAPGVPLAVLALGLCHYHLGAFGEAVRLWESTDLDAVGTPEILCRLAEAYLRGGKLPQALATARRAAERFPESAEAVLQTARLMVEVGAGEAAVRAYREALERLPCAEGCLELGEVAAQMGDAAAARAAFEQASQHAPERAEPHNNLGALSLNAGDLAGARAHLAKALRCNAGYDPAAWNLGRVYILAGEPRRALGLLRKRLHLGQRPVRDLLSDYQAWLEGTAPVGAVRHDPVPGILLAATAAIRAGETAAAMGWLAALEAAGVALEGVLPLQVEAQRANADLQAALITCMRWMQESQGPSQLTAAQEAGELLMQMGRYEEAASLIEAVLQHAKA